MALESDSRGFLVGDPIDLGRMPSDISHIRGDVSAIRRAIAGRWREYSRQPASSRPDVAVPARDSAGRFVSRATTAVAMPSEIAKADSTQSAIAAGAKAVVAERMLRSSVPVALPGRDQAGRFSRSGEGYGTATSSAIASIGDRLSRLSAATSGLEDADPMVKAAREIAEPLQRGFEFFRGDKQTGLLKKIFAKLSVFHKDETVYNRATKETLEKIEKKPTSVSTAGAPAFSLSSLLGAGGALAKAGKGLLRRVPLLGALLAAVSAVGDIFTSESSGQSRREKDRYAGSVLGGATGTIGGAIGGAAAGAFAGPVGMIVGAVVGSFLGDQAGQIIGDKFGGWVSDLREADLPGKISSAWDSAVSGISAKFTEAWGKVKDIGGLVTQVIGEQIGGVADYIKGVTGIDLKQQGAAWLDRTKANIGGAVNYTKQAASSLVDKTMQGVNWVAKNSTAGKAISKVAGFSETGTPERAMQLLMDKGWSKEDAAAIAANLNRESDLNTSALGDSGKAFGVAQWRPPRQAQFKKVFGKNLNEASFDEQVAFVDWELRNTHKSAGDAIRSAVGQDQKTAAVEQRYEISALGRRGGVQAERIADARKYASVSVPGLVVPQAPKAPMMPTPAEPPKIIEPLSSPVTPEFTLNLPSLDVGQNVSDSRIAHIASGGIGGGR